MDESKHPERRVASAQAASLTHSILQGVVVNRALPAPQNSTGFNMTVPVKRGLQISFEMHGFLATPLNMLPVFGWVKTKAKAFIYPARKPHCLFGPHSWSTPQANAVVFQSQKTLPTIRCVRKPTNSPRLNVPPFTMKCSGLRRLHPWFAQHMVKKVGPWGTYFGGCSPKKPSRNDAP